MKNQRRQFGLTLTELLVTVAIAAVLMAVAVPAARRITESMRDSAGARTLIGAALNNARAIAVREGTYAGVWFHRTEEGDTYMVFIVHDYDATALANGFRAVQGRKAIALPEGVAVSRSVADANPWPHFPIVFNSAGRLISHPVRYKDRLPFEAPAAAVFDSGGDSLSVNRFNTFGRNEPGNVNADGQSLYGELIGE